MVAPVLPEADGAGAVPVKVPGAPSGFVYFSTMFVPRFVLVKVQMTLSPGSELPNILCLSAYL
jgi:hypothetical protein